MHYPHDSRTTKSKSVGSFAQCTVFLWRTWHDNYVTSSKVCSSLRTHQKKRRASIGFSILVRQSVSDFDHNFSGFMTLQTTERGLHASLLHRVGLSMKLTIRQTHPVPNSLYVLLHPLSADDTVNKWQHIYTNLKTFITYGRSLLTLNIELIRLIQKGYN